MFDRVREIDFYGNSESLSERKRRENQHVYDIHNDYIILYLGELSLAVYSTKWKV